MKLTLYSGAVFGKGSKLGGHLMNDIWSKYVQGAKTLYHSRKLRFDDMFTEQYKTLFGLDETIQMRILEIGCGPGALAGQLRRWYPNAEIIAVDRDSEFIRFAREHESGITFMEGDATSLPFEKNSFDVVISNTVSKHIEPSRFYQSSARRPPPLRWGMNCVPDFGLTNDKSLLSYIQSKYSRYANKKKVSKWQTNPINIGYTQQRSKR